MDDIFARYREALQKGHEAAMEGRYRDALRLYQEAAETAVERAMPHVAMGAMHMRLRRPKEALAAYDRALERQPDDLDALSGRAAALLAAGRRAEAAAVNERVAQLRSAGPRPIGAPAGEATPLSAADTLQLAGEQARAAGDVEAALDAWLAESGSHAQDGHLDAALDACLRALSLSSGTPRVHLEMARLYFVRGWRDRALERLTLLDRLLQLDPDENARIELRRLAAEHLAGDDRLAALSGRKEQRTG